MVLLLVRSTLSCMQIKSFFASNVNAHSASNYRTLSPLRPDTTTGYPSETNFNPFEENCHSPFEQLELSVQNNCQSLSFAAETGLQKVYQPRYYSCIQYQHFSFGKMSLNQDLENLSTWLPQITCPSMERKPKRRSWVSTLMNLLFILVTLLSK